MASTSYSGSGRDRGLTQEMRDKKQKVAMRLLTWPHRQNYRQRHDAGGQAYQHPGEDDNSGCEHIG
jgi:hypothetical protein